MAGNFNSGRYPKPSAARKTAGSKQQEIHTPVAPAISDGMPLCPDFISDDSISKNKWYETVRILQAMKVLTEADLLIVANLCDSYSTMVKAKKILDREGMTSINEYTGCSQVNPLLRVIRQEKQVITALSLQLGLTPSARLRLAVNPNKEEKKNKFSDVGKKADVEHKSAASSTDSNSNSNLVSLPRKPEVVQ